MSRTLEESTVTTTRHKVEVVRVGEKLIIPDRLSLEDAVKVLQARIAYDSEVIEVSVDIDAPFILEAAYSFHSVLTEKYGWANMVPTPGFFGDSPPKMIGVPISLTETVQVAWGRFKLPGIEGHLETGYNVTQDERVIFRIGGKIRRRDEGVVNELADLTRKHIREHSIYRGKAFRVKFRDGDGDLIPMPTPEFIALDPNARQDLVLPRVTEASVGANIDVYIKYTDKVRARQMPLKRGVLLAGPFGTGKTMVATRTALLAVENGWTYVEAKDASELADAIRLARQYGPAVLFCEDIDRVMTGRRSVEMDEILNVIDGVESKGTELMVVLTTNELEKIHPAMLRPGRLDGLIHIGKPDAEAAERLARQYARGLISPDEALTKSATVLADNIPAVIREAVERAKAYAMMANPEGELTITDEDLFLSISEMQDHVKLLTPAEPDLRSDVEKAAAIQAEAQLKLAEAIRETPVVFPFPQAVAAGPLTALPAGESTPKEDS